MIYTNYTALDFAMDEHFQRWVYTHDAEVADFWQCWLALHPEKQALVEEAKSLLAQQQNIKSEAWSPDRMLEVQKKIESSLSQHKSISTQTLSKKDKPKKLSISWMAVAASLFLLISALIPVYIFSQEEEVYTTAYAETQQFTLPDGSEVILNANSSLRFAKDWEKDAQRQVWLNGEAFFKVSKLLSADTKSAVKFIVHLQDVDIEVVGTTFNVNNRSGKVEVSLDEGIVDLKTMEGERLRMEPGDMVAYSTETRKLNKRQADPDKISAWRQHQMLLDGQPLSELATLIKNYYGVEVTFGDQKLADRKIKTILPTDNLELVLETLELVLGVKASTMEERIILQ